MVSIIYSQLLLSEDHSQACRWVTPNQLKAFGGGETWRFPGGLWPQDCGADFHLSTEPLVCPTDFKFASLHYHTSQFLKYIFLLVHAYVHVCVHACARAHTHTHTHTHTQSWFCFLGEAWLAEQVSEERSDPIKAVPSNHDPGGGTWASFKRPRSRW